MIEIAAYAATAGVLGSYAMANRLGRPAVFDWGNAICFAPLVTANVIVGAWWSAVISGMFGVIGIDSLARRYKETQ